MGMAASQARYLALTARKSNIEYEGQQINQQRTMLSNQSANLFNQMLGLTVPTPPSTSDYTTLQYSYSDGINDSVISSWQQISDPDYNYVVTHYYYVDRYTGSQKKLSDPQVQFSGSTASSADEIQKALQKITETKAAYEKAKTEYEDALASASNLSTYANTSAYQNIDSSKCSYDEGNDAYSIYSSDGNYTYFYGHDRWSELQNDPTESITTMLQDLIDAGALSGSVDDYLDSVYYNEDGYIAFASDLEALINDSSATILTAYNIEETTQKAEDNASNVQSLKNAMTTALNNYNTAQAAYDELEKPSYVGNSTLTVLETLNDNQAAEIAQIVADMKEQGIDASINNCFDSDGNYIGGIYSFKLNGTTYYTTYQDLFDSYNSGTGNNHIDGQTKLTYYNASTVSTKVEETEKALLETDENGRFTSVRFENDTVVYTLNTETTTDEAAYQDAMNQYYYDNAIYDKTVQDINAKTSIIQQEDQQLELRLKQLDTEQNALSTEIDAVKKVVDDNVEKSFKTFSG